MLLTSTLQPNGPIAVAVLVDSLLSAGLQASDSAYKTHVIATAKLTALADRIDTAGLAFNALQPTHAIVAPVVSPAAQFLSQFLTVASSPLIVVILLLICIVGVGKIFYTLGSRQTALMLRTEVAEKQAADLLAKQDQLRGLLAERDRLFQEYVFMLQPLVTDEQYKEWNKASWKSFARNALSMTKLVRPLQYSDFRNRIRVNSVTFGQQLPTLDAKAWRLLSYPATPGILAEWDETISPYLPVATEFVAIEQGGLFIDSSSQSDEFPFPLEDSSTTSVAQQLMDLFASQPAAVVAPAPNPAQDFVANLMAGKVNPVGE